MNSLSLPVRQLIYIILCLSVPVMGPHSSLAQPLPRGAVKITKANTARFRSAGKGVFCYTTRRGRVPGKIFKKKIGKKNLRYFLALKSVLNSKLAAGSHLSAKARVKLRRRYKSQLRRARSACNGLPYTLTISAQNGRVARNPDRTGYASGTEVLLTAIPNAGHQFAAWDGKAVPQNNRTSASISIIMNSDVSLDAIFGPLPASECLDGIDNDGDDAVDFEDSGCFGPNAQETNADNGWTLFYPSSDTAIVYVSSSEGEDGNDGLSPARPVKTIAKGKELAYGGDRYGDPKRDNSPDWLLLRRGDTWIDEEFGQWNKSGRSPSEKMLIGTYGSSLERPLLKTGSGSGLSVDSISNLAVAGIDFYSHTRDPNSADFIAADQGGWGISVHGSSKDILVEGNRFRYYRGGINVQETGGHFDNVTLRRNVIAHSYSAMSHSQGLFTSGDGRLLIEENIFDHNGWSEDYPRHHRHLVLGNREAPDWRSIKDGRFRVKIDGSYYNIDSLDFSAVETMDDVAEAVRQGINAKVGNPSAVDVQYWKSLLLIKSNAETSAGIANVSQYTGAAPGTDIQRPEWFNGPDLCDPAGEPELPAHHRHMAPGTDLTAWRAVTDGSFSITINGTELRVTGMNFSAVAGMNEVASLIDNAVDAKAGSNIIDVWWEGPVMFFRSTAAAGASIGEIGGISGRPDITIASLLNCYHRYDFWYPAATVFNRNMYLSGGYGNTITRGNIDANGASGGMQQRMGGISEHNLVLRSPLGITFGSSQNAPNTLTSGVIRYNVVLGSHDIDDSPRGFGIEVGSTEVSTVGDRNGPAGSGNVEIHHNIVAHNRLGSSNVKGISLSGDGVFCDINIHDNIVYDWSRPEWPNPSDHRATAFSIHDINPASTNVRIHDNIFQQPRSGFAGSLNEPAAGVVQLYNNTYFSAEQDPPLVWSKGWFSMHHSVSCSEWLSKTGEPAGSLRKIDFADPERDVDTYMQLLGETPSYEAFMARAGNQSRYRWDPGFTAYAVNQYVREGLTALEQR